jgi:hypothetical protein
MRYVRMHRIVILGTLVAASACASAHAHVAAPRRHHDVQTDVVDFLYAHPKP